jgi:hypothetical protein
MEKEERFVWIVQGCWEHEGGEILKVFTAESDAQAFKVRCDAKVYPGGGHDWYLIEQHALS